MQKLQVLLNIAAGQSAPTGPVADAARAGGLGLRARADDPLDQERAHEPDQQDGYKGYPWKGTVQPHAMDETVAKKLWAFAEPATGLHYPKA